MNPSSMGSNVSVPETGGHQLIDIAKRFGLKRTGSVPTTLGKLKEMLRVDQKLKDKVDSAI